MKTDNELIAKFMGLCWITDWFSGYGWHNEQYELYHVDKMLYYHNSWDWLMRVVEKIEKLGFGVNIYCDSCVINRTHNRLTKNFAQINALEENKISATYKAVVEFIKWYNEQEKIVYKVVG